MLRARAVTITLALKESACVRVVGSAFLFCRIVINLKHPGGGSIMNLITNGRLITRDSEGKGYYEHGAVAYEGATIVEVGEESALRAPAPRSSTPRAA